MRTVEFNRLENGRYQVHYTGQPCIAETTNRMAAKQYACALFNQLHNARLVIWSAILGRSRTVATK